MNLVSPVCEVVRGAIKHARALLSFSLGKDSWAAWLSARDYFDFTPYYLYLVLGLEFVQDYIGYAEQKLGKHIVQTREQKEHFLSEAKLLQTGYKYIDGALLAKRMGIALPPVQVPYNVSAKMDAKYAALVKDL